MDSDVREILGRFENLDSPARRVVYRHVLSQLHLHEWRDVRDLLDKVSFHKDILGTLPLEVALQITRYLALSELHVLRRVSRGWHSLLSSDVVCDAALRRYAGRKTDSVALGTLGKFSAYARHRTRLERGQPLWKAHYPTYQPLPKASEVATLDYCNGRVAWIEEGTTLVVHNLHSRATQYFCTQNRDRFVGMRLSDCIIGAVSSRGHCQVWDLRSEGSSWFRLPSLQHGLFVASGTSVALSFSDALAKGAYVLHWDLMSHTARTIAVAPHLGYMALNATAKTLTTVHLEARSQDDDRVDTWAVPAYYDNLRVVTHLLHGSRHPERLPSYILNLPATEQRQHLRIGPPNEGSNFSDRIGIFSILETERQTSASCPVVAVFYEPSTDQLALHILHPEHAPFYPLCMTAVDQNILYYLRNDNGKPQIAISNPAAATPHRPSIHMNLQLPREATNRVYSHITCFALRGDHELTLMIDENGLKVWCFDEAIYPSDT